MLFNQLFFVSCCRILHFISTPNLVLSFIFSHFPFLMNQSLTHSLVHPTPPPFTLPCVWRCYNIMNYRYLVSFINLSEKHSRLSLCPPSPPLIVSLNPPCTDDLTSRWCSSASAPGSSWTRLGIQCRTAIPGRIRARTSDRRSWMLDRGRCSTQTHRSHGSLNNGTAASCSICIRSIEHLQGKQKKRVEVKKQ